MEEIVKRRQHYLPKAYMQFFARQERKAKKLYTYFRKDGKIAYVSIDDICWRPYLYEQLFSFSDRKETFIYAANAIENSFITLEGEYASIVSKLAHDIRTVGKVEISVQEKEKLALFAALLLVRNPYIIHLLNRTTEFFLNQEPGFFRSMKENLPEVDDSVLVAAIKQMHLQEILNYNLGGRGSVLVYAMQRLLMEDQLCLLRTKGSTFISSDAPIVNIWGDRNGEEFDLLGFPITPDLFLAFVDTKGEVAGLVEVNDKEVWRINNKQTHKASLIFLSNQEDLLAYIAPNYEEPEDLDDTAAVRELVGEAIIKLYERIMGKS